MFTACRESKVAISKAEPAVSEQDMEPIICRWDFSEVGRVYSFEYKQSMEQMPGQPKDSKINVSATLSVTSNSDGTARVELTDAIISDGKQEHKMPSSGYDGLRSDGTSPSAISNQDAFMRLLLPIPTDESVIGKNSSQEITFPVKSNSVMGYVPIQTTITLMEKREGIALFKVVYNSGKAVSTSGGEFPEEFEMRLNGTGTTRFDYVNGKYLSGSISLEMGFKSNHGHEPDLIKTSVALTSK
jgi:hypothetical protein